MDKYYQLELPSSVIIVQLYLSTIVLALLVWFSRTF